MTTTVSPQLPSGVILGQPSAALSTGSLLGVVSAIGTIASLRAYAGVTQPTVYVEGYYLPGDGGGDLFLYNGGDTTSSDNGGSIIVDASSRRWYRLFDGKPYSLRAFGAKLDGSTDDTLAITNCIAAAAAAGARVFHPGGNAIYTGALILPNKCSIYGVDSYSAPVNDALTQTSKITFHGNGAGLVLGNANSGAMTLEKIGFVGLPGTYSNQTGLLLSDSLRVSLGEGWPTLRDVLFLNFNIGIDVGNSYQTGYMFNVYIANSVTIGYRNLSEDWYHEPLYCGSNSTIASVAQVQLGQTATNVFGGCGTHQFVGGAFFGATNTIIMQNTFANQFSGCIIQNANQNGVLIGSGAYGAANNTIENCVFSGNNASGGSRNTNALSYYDICISDGGSRNNKIDCCTFGIPGAGGANGSCPAGAIYVGTNGDGTTINGNTFQMDMFVTPGLSGHPSAVVVNATYLANSIDHIIVCDNIRTYGDQGVLATAYAPLDLSAIVNPIASVALGNSISITAGVCVISPPSGNFAMFLPSPGYAGRYLTIMAGGGTGNNISSAVVNSINGNKQFITFGAQGSWITMVSISATGWFVTGSNGATLT